MIRLIILATVGAVILSPTSGIAQSVYRCTVDGKPVFQDRPCPGSRSADNVVDVRAPARGSGAEVNLPTDLSRQWEHRQLIAQQKVRVGMTTDQARQSWGAPTSINRSSAGREQWVYHRDAGKAQYLYMQNGVVVSWQE